jgi:Uma2 family endonuclease
MSTATVPALITAEQFLEMHFDGPVELVRGEIVEIARPDQSHGNVCNEIAYALTSWAKRTASGRVTTNDSGILTERDPDTVRGADVAFFATSQLANGKLPRGQSNLVPLLCAEVLSPSNSWTEMRRKIDEYLAVGVREVWIVDPDARTVEAFRQDAPPVLHRQLMTLTSRELSEFSVPVAELFAGVQ